MLELTDDQEFFRSTTARFLSEHAPVSELRRLRDDADGFTPGYWSQGAELGWTSLLVDEAHGGGTISGDGLLDLTLVATELGRRAAPGPLASVNVVAATLSEIDGTRWASVLADLLSGDALATWCLAEPAPTASLGWFALDVHLDGDDVVLNGTKRPVESATRAQHLLVTGRTGSGLSQVLLPTDAPGIRIDPLRTVDLTRRFDRVTFDDVRVPAANVVGELGGAGAQAERQLQRALVLANAESVGVMDAAFDMTVEWAFDRYSFGRPLASYQALKHRYADMYAWLQASHAISDDAAAAVAADAPDAALLVSAAKAFIGQYGSELLQECVQMHGGIGVTFEHDIHLYLRRHTVNAALHGTAGEHRRRITDLLDAPEVAA